MNNLQNLQQPLETATAISNIRASLALAMERTSQELKNIDSVISDIQKEFSRTSEQDILKALKSGALGKYGRTYKLCSQEVCIWIRAYKKEISDNTLKL